ncbi:hypothetical protein N566_00325 [Streptomycetaceae bacterium MP113-05]|nr:hypothetical protein N566_00325 [Streptomycetaceae bacterium MP113-05]
MYAVRRTCHPRDGSHRRRIGAARPVTGDEGRTARPGRQLRAAEEFT